MDKQPVVTPPALGATLRVYVPATQAIEYGTVVRHSKDLRSFTLDFGTHRAAFYSNSGFMVGTRGPETHSAWVMPYEGGE